MSYTVILADNMKLVGLLASTCSTVQSTFLVTIVTESYYNLSIIRINNQNVRYHLDLSGSDAEDRRERERGRREREREREGQAR